MYIIRSLAAPQRLEITVSGRVDERELLRLISQSAAMAEADGSQYVFCDLDGLTSAPEDIYPIAAALAVVQAPILRIAVVAPPETDDMVGALTRGSGTAHGVRIFRTQRQAMAWLQHCADATARSSTALRHGAALTAARRRETRGSRLRSVPGRTTAA